MLVVYVYSRTIARLLARGRWGTFWFGLLGRRDMWGMAYRRVLERIMFSDLLAFWITYVVFMSLGGFASYTLVRALGSILAGDIELAAAQTGIGAAELLACGISYKFISLFATQLRENKRILTKMVRMWDKHMLQMHASHKWSLHDRSGEVEEPDIGPEQLEELLSILQGADLDAEVLADRSSERRRTGMETDDED